MVTTNIAVVTVCLNDQAGLQATYNSLRSQTAEAAQWIVVDGKSSDGTRQWLESLAWPPLDWSSEPDRGIFDGMNKGLRRVQSDYVLFLNSGDTLASPDILLAVAKALTAARPRPSLLFGDSFEIDATGAKHLRRARGASWIRVGMPTTHQAMFFRVDGLPEFDTSYKLSGDYAAVAEMYSRKGASSFLYLPRTLCCFVLGGRSGTQWRLLLDEHRQIRRSVLGMGYLAAWILHVLHHVHERIKQHVPFLHRVFRYG